VRYGFFPGCAYKTAAGYRESVEALNRALAIQLVEIPDWNCCGATAVFSINSSVALVLSGRLLALADLHGFDEIITVCNACYTTLRKAIHMMEHHPELITEINKHLKTETLQLKRLLPVRHYLDVLANDIPEMRWRKVKQSKSDSDLRVAAYYGCQLTRPWKDQGQPERPDVLEQFLERLGVTVIEHSAKTLCCGASHMIPYAKDCAPLVSRIIREVRKKNGNIIATICPMCQFNLDAGQGRLNIPGTPVAFFTQIVGLALGIDSKDLGIDKLLVPMYKISDNKE